MDSRKADKPPIIGKLQGVPPCDEERENSKMRQYGVNFDGSKQQQQTVLGGDVAAEAAPGDGQLSSAANKPASPASRAPKNDQGLVSHAPPPLIIEQQNEANIEELQDENPSPISAGPILGGSRWQNEV